MTIKRTTKISTDAYRVMETRSEQITLNLNTASEEDFQQFDDARREGHLADVERIEQILNGARKSVVGFWLSEGLPAKPEGPESAQHHPAAEADAGSFVHTSWRVWRYMQAAQTALEAQLHRAFWLAYCLGRIMGETDIAMRHGQNAKVGANQRTKSKAVAEEHHRHHAEMHQDWRSRNETLLAVPGLGPNRRARAIHVHWPDQELNTIIQFVKREDRKRKQEKAIRWMGTSSHVPEG